MCCCYFVGALIFSSSSITPMMATLTGTQAAGLGGMFVLGLSAGLMKAVYTSLGPDQFKVPEQRDQQKRFVDLYILIIDPIGSNGIIFLRYFNAFYWMINAGAFIGQFMTAQLRESVQCFGDDCYMLPFLILCGIMAVSTFVFYSGIINTSILNE